MEKYVYNKDGLKFERQRFSPGRVLLAVLKFFVISLGLAVVYYLIAALLFNTGEESRLKAENSAIEEQLAGIEEKTRLLDNVISGLEARDKGIYSNIFESDPISSDWQERFGFLDALDSLPDDRIVALTSSAVSSAESRSSVIKGRLKEIAGLVSSEGADSIFSIPMSSPIADFSVSQTGASVGKKMNPFYKILFDHTGLDILAQAGDKVLASAPGVVKEVVRSKKGMGNYVVIDHGHGYESVYAHLSEINVRRGRRVERGDQVGVVGVTGLTFAAHLHYEIRKDGKAVNPVHYFFASETPGDYIGMIRLSAGMGQSLD